MIEPEQMKRPIVPVRKDLKTLAEIKQAMLTACRIMDHFGLIQGFGHVTSRIPGTSNILVTPKKAPGLAKEEDLVILDMEGKRVSGSATPLGEINMHLGIYRKRPDVGAICRFHSEMASVFGALNRSVKVVHAFGYVLGPEVKVLDSSHIRHTAEVTDEMGRLIAESWGIIFRGNGAATFGANIIDACVRAMFFEESARIQYKASLIGTPVYLSAAEINQRNETYWDMPEYDVYGRAWEYFSSKV
ncbi:MAG: class II aldolase/adducin family protein [Deltaproteobacteria bacterium]|nr:class II aldolase/adducin family protein [Deltaproteobacteria bacterium]MDZ4346309.1 class II aldolase/adducin family protein [Candidatus Binatia bacterium]